MGISNQVARLIVREHRCRPVTGNLLMIGRQTVQLTPDQAVQLVEAETETKITTKASYLEIDDRTRNAHGRHFVSDRAFFSLFSQAEYHCLDVSSYEGAQIVFDLCDPSLPEKYEGRFDFIYDGSSLDNIFDPAQAIRNLARLLKPGGRIIQVNRSSRTHSEYVAFALSWFHDFYSVNQFDDCQVFLAQHDGETRWDFYRYDPLREQNGIPELFGQDTYYFPWRHANAVVVAEKSSNSTWHKTPVQYQYRAGVPGIFANGTYETLGQSTRDYAADPYVRAPLRFRQSERAKLLIKPDEKTKLPSEFLHYAPQISYCGSLDRLAETSSPLERRRPNRIRDR